MNGKRSSLCALACATLILTSCKPSLDRVEGIDAGEVLKDYLTGNAPPINMLSISNQETLEQNLDKLKKDGFEIKDESEKRNFTMIGRHGKNLNVVYAKLDFLRKISANAILKNNSSQDRPDLSHYSIQIETFGNNYKVISYDLRVSSDEIASGPPYASVATELSTQWNMPLTDFPSELVGQKTVGTSKTRKLGDTPADISISGTLKSCFPPYKRNQNLTQMGKNYPSDANYNNHVCNVSGYYYDKGFDEMWGKLYSSAQATYVQKFGRPDCWVSDSGCVEITNDEWETLQAEIEKRMIAKK